MHILTTLTEFQQAVWQDPKPGGEGTAARSLQSFLVPCVTPTGRRPCVWRFLGGSRTADAGCNSPGGCGFRDPRADPAGWRWKPHSLLPVQGSAPGPSLPPPPPSCPRPDRGLLPSSYRAHTPQARVALVFSSRNQLHRGHRGWCPALHTHPSASIPQPYSPAVSVGFPEKQNQWDTWMDRRQIDRWQMIDRHIET